MPFKSEEQRKAMYAASAGKSTIGIPKEVGEKFIEHRNDSLGAAGILHRSGNRILLIKRSDCSDKYPSHWAFPGGHIEVGETPFNAAVRESFEEVGYNAVRATALGTFDSDGVPFHAFMADGEFNPRINDESSDFGWFDVRQLPNPMIPSCREIIDMVYPNADDVTEMDVMKKIRDGELPSPQQYGNIWLFAIRVTGTGIAVRADGEIAHKSPHDYLTNEFLERCNGLPVIWQHPKERLLDTESFQDQIVGTSSLPYINGDEVWTIARIYHERAAQLMTDKQLSTSPAVKIGSAAVKHGDFLIEGKPVYLDHIAVCPVGVWDKGSPDGVKVDSLKEAFSMDKDELLSLFKTAFDEHAIRMDAKFDEVHNRIDSLKEEADKEKADAKHEDEAEDKKLIKSEIKKAEHVVKDDSKDEDEDSIKDDSACGKTVMADAAHDKADAKHDMKDDSRVDSRIADLESQIAELKGRTKELSADDRSAIASAQARADSLAMALGDNAGIYPVTGEGLFSYRKRLAAKFSQFSNRFKEVDISKIADETLFKPVEDAVYADAFEYAKAPAVAEGTVHMMEQRDEAGRMVRTPTANSDPRAWMGMFANGAVKHGNIRLS